MTVVTLTNFLNMSSEEMKVINIIDRLNKRDEIKEHAAFILTIMGKLKKLSERKMEMRLISYIEEKKKLSEKLGYHFNLFKNKSRLFFFLFFLILIVSL